MLFAAQRYSSAAPLKLSPDLNFEDIEVKPLLAGQGRSSAPFLYYKYFYKTENKKVLGEKTGVKLILVTTVHQSTNRHHNS